MKVYEFNPPKETQDFPVVGRFLGIWKNDKVNEPTVLVFRSVEYAEGAGRFDDFQIAIPKNATIEFLKVTKYREDQREVAEARTYTVKTAERTWKIITVTIRETQRTFAWIA